MGVRTNSEITFQIGRDNALLDFIADFELGAILDTLDHATSHNATLAAGESGHIVPFGDVAECRLIYIESDGDIRISPGGAAATAAQIDGVGGSYPTGFAGGEELPLEIDDTFAFTVTFTVGASVLVDVINEINAAAALAGVVGPGSIPATIARDNGGGQLRLISPTTGASSEIDILAGSALAALGLVEGVTNGVASIPGQTPITLRRPANPAGASAAAGVKSYLLATLVTSSLLIDNLDSANEASIVVALAGDLLLNPPTDC